MLEDLCFPSRWLAHWNGVWTETLRSYTHSSFREDGSGKAGPLIWSVMLCFEMELVFSAHFVERKSNEDKTFRKYWLSGSIHGVIAVWDANQKWGSLQRHLLDKCGDLCRTEHYTTTSYDGCFHPLSLDNLVWKVWIFFLFSLKQNKKTHVLWEPN